MRNRSWILTLLLPLLLWGCESDSDNGGGGGTANFAGTWNITQTVVSKTMVCDNNQVGDTETGTIVLLQDGATITIVTDGDDITLTADGSTATGTNVDNGRTETIEITVSGNSLTGEVTVSGDCDEVRSITGTREAAPSQDFLGYWDVSVTVQTSNCEDETPGDSFTECMSIMADGNTLFLDDGSNDGIFTGTASGNTATFTRSDVDGDLTVTITLTPGGFGFTGNATYNQSDPECTATYSLSASKRSSDCEGGNTGGDWAGYWDSTVSNIQDGCEDGVVGGCVEFIQDGSVFYPADNPSETYQISGNSATYFFSESFEGSSFTVDIDLTLNGDTITGDALISVSGEFNCTTTFDITANRRSSPCPTQARAGWLDLVRH